MMFYGCIDYGYGHVRISHSCFFYFLLASVEYFRIYSGKYLFLICLS